MKIYQIVGTLDSKGFLMVEYEREAQEGLFDYVWKEGSLIISIPKSKIGSIVETTSLDEDFKCEVWCVDSERRYYILKVREHIGERLAAKKAKISRMMAKIMRFHPDVDIIRIGVTLNITPQEVAPD